MTDVPERVLVTGASGMLGSELCLSAPAGVTVVGTDLRDAPEGTPSPAATGVDLADLTAVERLFEEHGPFQGVIHAAAYTAVDQAEAEEELAYRVNAVASRCLATVCAGRGVPLVVVSTDFVFDGTKREPYREDDPPSPLGAYGRTKLSGEQAALELHADQTRIVRTQWLYGPRGKHFPGTMLRLAGERDRLRVVSDQFGAPTSTLELAPALWDALRRVEPGIYHASCEGECSWYDFAVATLELAGVEGVTVEPCPASEYERAAPVPDYSVLDCTRLGEARGKRLAPWRDALAAYLESEA